MKCFFIFVMQRKPSCISHSLCMAFTSIFTCENKGGKIPIYTFLLHILKLHNEQFSNFALTRMSLLHLYFILKNKMRLVNLVVLNFEMNLSNTSKMKPKTSKIEHCEDTCLFPWQKTKTDTLG